MSQVEREETIEDAKIVLGLLESVERDGTQTQRRIAAELGIALGLVNAYVKRCIKKGLLKVNEAPARRYVYYLTPQGFSEKSKLTVQYLSSSFSFFRRARAECAEVLGAAKAAGAKRVALAGVSDLADIMRLCAAECGVDIVAIVDPSVTRTDLAGIPIVASFADVAAPFDAVVVTDLVDGSGTLRAVVQQVGITPTYVPKLLGLNTRVRAQ